MAVKSAERVLRIFEHLSGFPNGLTAKEISTQLGYAVSSTFELLKTLSDNDYLIENERKRYSLGPKLIQLGVNASSYLDINKVATPLLTKLMEDLEETIFMAVLSLDEVVYVAKINSYKTISTNANIGSRKPIYCTGLGKAFLTFMPEKETLSIIDKLELEPLTPNTVQTKEALLEQIKHFRKLGYAIDNEEIEQGLWCVAVPVYDAANRMIVAVSVSGPKVRMMPKKDKIISKMLRLSEALSKRMGCMDQQ